MSPVLEASERPAEMVSLVELALGRAPVSRPRSRARSTRRRRGRRRARARRRCRQPRVRAAAMAATASACASRVRRQRARRSGAGRRAVGHEHQELRILRRERKHVARGCRSPPRSASRWRRCPPPRGGRPRGSRCRASADVDRGADGRRRRRPGRRLGNAYSPQSSSGAVRVIIAATRRQQAVPLVGSTDTARSSTTRISGSRRAPRRSSSRSWRRPSDAAARRDPPSASPGRRAVARDPASNPMTPGPPASSCSEPRQHAARPARAGLKLGPHDAIPSKHEPSSVGGASSFLSSECAAGGPAHIRIRRRRAAAVVAQPDAGRAAARVPAARRCRAGRSTSAARSGRVLVIDFFAAYCRPCQRTLPALEALHRREPELSIVGVSLDETRRRRAQSVARHHLTFPVVHDAGNVLAGRFRVTELPVRSWSTGRGVSAGSAARINPTTRWRARVAALARQALTMTAEPRR